MCILLATTPSKLAAPTEPRIGLGLEPVKRAITRLQPRHDDKEASRLASAFYSVSNSCGVSWEALVSIAFNESSLGAKKVNPKSKDYGIMQINDRMIVRLGLDKARVMSDDKYSIEAACRILNFNRDAYQARHGFWLGIYRSGTALHKKNIRDNAVSYDRIVRNTMKKIRAEALSDAR